MNIKIPCSPLQIHATTILGHVILKAFLAETLAVGIFFFVNIPIRICTKIIFDLDDLKNRVNSQNLNNSWVFYCVFRNSNKKLVDRYLEVLKTPKENIEILIHGFQGKLPYNTERWPQTSVRLHASNPAQQEQLWGFIQGHILLITQKKVHFAYKSHHQLRPTFASQDDGTMWPTRHTAIKSNNSVHGNSNWGVYFRSNHSVIHFH